MLRCLKRSAREGAGGLWKTHQNLSYKGKFVKTQTLLLWIKHTKEQIPQKQKIKDFFMLP